MQIQNINSTNFNGGYKFIGMSAEARAELGNVVKKGKTIYDSFQGNPNDVFMVAKDNFHKAILLFIQKHNLKCQYYPEVKSSMNFKLGHPEQLEQIIETQTPEEIVFDEETDKELSEYQRRTYVNQHEKDYLPNILDILKLDMDAGTCREKRGVKIFQNKNHTKDIYVSPPDKNNKHYVKVFSKVSSSDPNTVKLYEINLSPENKVVDYTNRFDKWSDFNRNFENTLLK